MTTVGERYRGSIAFLRVYRELMTAAECRGIVRYMTIASHIGIDTPGNRMAREVGQVLGEVSEDEHNAGRPMLSAVAVSSEGKPSEGFYVLARKLGKLASEDKAAAESFWRTEQQAIYKDLVKVIEWLGYVLTMRCSGRSASLRAAERKR